MRTRWLADLAGIATSRDYARRFELWKSRFLAVGDRLAELTLTSRLLIGHGNASATGIGITVHHTWGVPIIPGSALKGLLAHYVDSTYGPSEPDREPWEHEGEERERFGYQGVTWDGRRTERGPGAVYRGLFGAPDANDDDAMRKHGFDAGASAGLVTFHDAIYVPESIEANRPFAADVLTVHQTDYYDSSGKSWPNDYDSPKPVAFLTVRPKCRFLLALSGPADWTELAGQLLKDALEKWGVGSRTSAGFGLGNVGVWRPPELRASKALAEFETWLVDEANAAAQRQRLSEIAEHWLPKLLSLSDDERQRAASAVRRVIKSPKLTAHREQIVAQLKGKPAP
jgi:CRISPR-associated protein Cmr6